MFTPLMPESVPKIDANLVIFYGGWRSGSELDMPVLEGAKIQLINSL